MNWNERDDSYDGDDNDDDDDQAIFISWYPCKHTIIQVRFLENIPLFIASIL